MKFFFSYFWSSYLIFLVIVSSVQCQSFTVPSETCPGERVSFTCLTNDGATSWLVTPPGDICSYSGTSLANDSCGPGRRFTSSPVDDGDLRSSSLSVVLSDDINGTMVQCQEAIINGDIIGSSSVCVSDIVESPTFSESVMISGDKWVVSWSEVLDSCNNPVSQYMLCVTPLTTSGGGSGQGMTDCYNVSNTQFELTINASVSLAVKGMTCNNITGPPSEPFTIIFSDVINVTTVTPEYNDGGILESITVAGDGDVFLEFDGLRVEVNVTITLSAQNTLPPPDANVDDIVVVTSNLSVTIPVPPKAIAEYRLTLTVPGTQPIDLTPDLIPSELKATDLSRVVVSVDISGSCSSIVTCLEGDNCTVYCGSSADLDSLDMRNESTSVSNDGDIDVRLPPTFDEEFHCIVSGGNTSNGSLLFRVRTLDFKTGCPVDELLVGTDEEPVCEEEDGDCNCTLNSDDGCFEVMYNSTSVGSTADLFVHSNCCYNGSQNETIRIFCDATEQWIRNVDYQLFIIAVELEITSNSVIVILIAIGVICFVIGVVGAVIVVVLVVKTPTSRIRIWFRVLFGATSVVTVAAIIMWIVVVVYLPSHGGVNDESGMTGDPVICKYVTNDDIRVILVAIKFTLSVPASFLWVISLTLHCRIIVHKSPDPKNDDDSGTGTTTAGVGMTTVGILSAVDYTSSTGEGEDDKQYDVLNHPKPSSPTPLLSDTDPAYGKLGKTVPPPDAQHYGKLDHTGGHIKKAAVAPVGEEEYGKLDRKQMQPMEPGHYGKLDRSSNKTATLPSQIAAGQGEYGKLDRSQMEDPEHYGKLDHPGKKVASLPPGALPPTNEGYGKLDSNRREMEIEMKPFVAESGMYDTVTDKPRHVPKSRRQGSSGH